MSPVLCMALLAACARVPVPRPPRIIIARTPAVACAGMRGRCYDAACTVRYDGTCAGTYMPRTQTVRLGSDAAALPHELLHHVLCRAGRCDTGHADASWHTCLPVCEEGE